MKRATFYVDYLYEAGSNEYGANLTGRYQFWIDMLVVSIPIGVPTIKVTIIIIPNLIQLLVDFIWLYNTINRIATEMLNMSFLD